MSGDPRESNVSGVADASDVLTPATLERSAADAQIAAVATEVSALAEGSRQHSRSRARERAQRVWSLLLAGLRGRAA